MRPTTAGTFRVFESPRAGDELLFLDRETGDPTYVPLKNGDEIPTGEPDGDENGHVGTVRQGHLVDATLAWEDGDPRVTELDVQSRTLFSFVDGATDVFDAARGTFREGCEEGLPVNSQVTRGTGGDANGVIYTVAKQPGEKDVFAEFRDGRMSLEPLVRKVEEGGEDPPFEVFVIRPANEPFVLVYLVLGTGGLLADTVRDEYGCARPPEIRV